MIYYIVVSFSLNVKGGSLMKRIFLLAFCLIFLFCGCTPEKDEEETTKSESSYTEEKDEQFSGVWLTYTELSVKGKNYTEKSYTDYIGSLFDTFLEKKITDVFVHVRPFADALYFSDIFEFSEYASGKRGEKGDFDILRICIDEGKKRGLGIHAWINPYRVSAGTAECLTDGIIKGWYDNEKGLVCTTKDGVYLNPASLKVQRLIVEGIREILSEYEVNGIHFDDYFYPPLWENADKDDYKRYKSEGGKLSLYDFRRENVNNLLLMCYDTVKSFRADLIFSVSPSGDIERNQNEIFADVSLWCKGGYCDMIIPQLYYGFQNESKPFGKVLYQWLSLCKDSEVKLVAGLALYKVNEEDEFAGKGRFEWLERDDIIRRQRELSLEKGAFGVAYFSTSYMENLKF